MFESFDLDDLRDRLDSIKGNLDALTRERNKIIEGTRREQEGLENVTELLSDTQTLNINAFIEFVDDFSKTAQGRLYENFLKATNVAPEFNYTFYKEGFLKAITNEDTILATYDLDTLEFKNFYINLNQTAGTLEEYASAVAEARAEMKLGATRGQQKTNKEKYEEEEQGADLASTIWYNKIYGTARLGFTVVRKYKSKKKKPKDVTARYKKLYDKTLKKRESYFTHPAPWWQLLDKGNSISRIADSSGSAMPSNEPTNFVENTKTWLKENWLDYRNKYREQMRQDLEKKQAEHTKNLENLDTYLKELESNLYEDTPEFKVSLEDVVDYLTKIGKVDLADKGKVMAVAYKISQGEKVGRVRLTHGVRIRTEELARDIQEAIGVLSGK